MKSVYDPKTDLWNVKMPDYLSKHDVVFLTPVDDPTFGLPIGDGDMGMLVSVQNNGIVIHVNKTDLWDDAKNQEFEMWKKEGYEKRTSCRHGAKIVIDFSAPALDVLYQKDYEARISLKDATAFISSMTHFSKVEFAAFAEHGSKTAVISIKTRGEINPRIMLERWGSRTFSGWFGHIRRDASIGIKGTKSFSGDNKIYLTQELNGTSFCVMIQLESRQHFNSKTINNHAVCFEKEYSTFTEFKLYVTIGVSHSVEKSVQAAENQICNAVKLGGDALYKVHKKQWADFWNRSFVHIENDFIENLWYLNLYYANSQMRGRYPAHFCNGIWNFEHDFIPWNYYFHYNMQLATFPLNTANHAELLDTYLNYRVNQLSKACEFCKEKKGFDGALYTDVSDKFGNNDCGIVDNCTPGAQIALELWTNYEYNCDEEYLNNKVLPVMKEVCKFYINMLRKDENGVYHIYSTSAYESSPLVDDAITDIAMIKKIFSIMSSLSKDEIYQDIAANIAQPTLLEMENDEWDGKYFTKGIGKGQRVFGSKIISEGRRCDDGKWIRKSFGNREREMVHGFPDTELSMIFPSGNIGIKDAGSDLFNAQMNQLLLHPCADVKITFTEGKCVSDTKNLCMGWCLVPIMLARMGRKAEFMQYLEDTISTWLIYPQGFGHYGVFNHMIEDHMLRWKTYEVTDVETGEKVQLGSWRFRHFDYETLPIVATAINESMIQSYDGTIRLFPAVDSKTAAFRLMAQGGFEVNAVKDADDILVSIKSLKGGKLRLSNPFHENEIAIDVYDGMRNIDRISVTALKCGNENVFEFDTEIGMRYVFDVSKKDIIPLQYSSHTNKREKYCKKARLGIGKMY